MVENEILQFMDSLIVAFNSVSAENVFNYFLKTDEFVVATQGRLIVNPNALLDTMKVHLAVMEKQETKNEMDKIFVITKDAAVISTSKIVTLTFKSGGEVTMPYALTMLLVKREGDWKIAHYHN
jgi:ketosteroid isomerase-like protein